MLSFNNLLLNNLIDDWINTHTIGGIPLKKVTDDNEAVTEYGSFSVLPNDFIGDIMLRGEHFEKECIKHLLPLISVGDIILDIGANIGCYAVPFAQKGGRVYAFEPQQKIYDLLVKNVEKYPNITAVHSAMGHKITMTTLNGLNDMNLPLDYNSKDIVNLGGLNLGLNGEEVLMLTIDSYCKNMNVRMIKIDVEGAEKLVIIGGLETIKRCRPIIFYESNFKQITDEMVMMFHLTKFEYFFDIMHYLKETLHYTQIIKIKDNFLCIP
jgi:FkbM family methyltransferase